MMCDCELSHNGVGMVGRECDCPAGTTGDVPSVSAAIDGRLVIKAGRHDQCLVLEIETPIERIILRVSPRGIIKVGDVEVLAEKSVAPAPGG